MATAETEHDVAGVVQRLPDDDIGNVRPADRTVRPRAGLMTGPPGGFPQCDYRRGNCSELRNGPTRVSRSRNPKVKLPLYAHHVRARGKEYFYYNPGRGTDWLSGALRLPGTPSILGGVSASPRRDESSGPMMAPSKWPAALCPRGARRHRRFFSAPSPARPSGFTCMAASSARMQRALYCYHAKQRRFP
jgi:hypothetical protein